ncbi:MAG: hypothetical protein GY862_08870 [Gammaproteobacteria bacterium]|nr:hypothetical protein [Gammaproteobacteria bacterium]
MKKHPKICCLSPDFTGLEEINKALEGRLRSVPLGKVRKEISKILLANGFSHVSEFVYQHEEDGKNVEVCKLGPSLRIAWVTEQAA